MTFPEITMKCQEDLKNAKVNRKLRNVILQWTGIFKVNTKGKGMINKTRRLSKYSIDSTDMTLPSLQTLSVCTKIDPAWKSRKSNMDAQSFTPNQVIETISMRKGDHLRNNRQQRRNSCTRWTLDDDSISAFSELK